VTRIIAGAARGRRLAVPGSGTRPTSDRVREALFSALESEWVARGITWPEVTVLDLFAGTGALGLEALSRGAAQARLVERSRLAARTLAANVAAVGCPGAEVVTRDAAQLAALPAPTPAARLVFADPPYDWPAHDLARLLGRLRAAEWIAADAVIVVERPARDPVSPFPEGWPEPRRRPYGDTVLWYGRVASIVEGDEGDEDDAEEGV
jgi:16S rRNA (guanine966-N2)-methyltransferase